jgi:hypothetical protein
MRSDEKKIFIFTRNVLFLISLIGWLLVNCHSNNWNNGSGGANMSLARISEIKSMDNGTKWTRCFVATDGIIYFKDNLMSKDGGKTLMAQQNVNVEEINGAPERAVLATEKLFHALDGPTEYVSPGLYKGKSWRSVDNLKTLQQEEVTIYIPDGAKPRKDVDKWYGIFVYRTILKMPDGSWLMTMYGNFVADTLAPADKDAIEETQFMMRTIIVTSTDEGHTWKYLSTVATPEQGEPVGEGFVEPAITLLKDGRLLCIMRAGHHYPLYASWSSDLGKTWTPPMYTGLDRGCDPCLITLQDGRVALSWGRRFPEGWSTITREGDKGRYVYPGEGYTSLSISNDGGVTWTSHKIIRKSGSCYSTIFEVEPNVVFMQVDQWYCRITLNPMAISQRWSLIK